MGTKCLSGEVLSSKTIQPFGGQKTLRDYQSITALSNTVDGTFAGRGLAVAQNANGFDRSSNIDPFFFSVLSEPLPPPQLTIALSAATVILTWPTNVAGFTSSSSSAKLSAD
jgi:hypothetical protein